MKTHKSVLKIGAIMAQDLTNDTSDKRIEGMGNHFPSSSSSSSEDELPDFLKPQPLNVVYANQPNVRIVSPNGQLVKEVPREEFLSQNPQFESITPIQGFTPAGFPNGFPQPQYAPQVFFNPSEENKNPQAVIPNSTSPPTVQVEDNAIGEFSSKYKEKLEEDKIRKTKLQTNEDIETEDGE
eukprot:CAMPEP_0205820010 /NCGR_PEP_ID=MMETSP0206-20130828/2583_1 /ASSEMBLY_ACC=CAM_ASM_000279 /TAXON_ID=36767 /ORGANISM="Euplotes focardii, Strain TN1" /LENGTH=181 /DNA_ID=CAMNT_0053114295 /DNA_START=1064 /DNA_END=1609 /DNA_ORIENTATION=+